jgi:hypothetical protein
VNCLSFYLRTPPSQFPLTEENLTIFIKYDIIIIENEERKEEKYDISCNLYSFL